MERLVVSRHNLPAVYIRDTKKEKFASIAFELISGAATEGKEMPRVAIARHYTEGRGSRGSSAISFATPGWTTPVLSEVEYAIALPKVGLVTTRHVTTWAFAEIALSL
jgi:hypothetical protein